MSGIGKTDFFKRGILSFPGTIITPKDLEKASNDGYVPSPHGVMFFGLNISGNIIGGYPTYADASQGFWDPREVSTQQFKKISSYRNAQTSTTGTAITVAIDTANKLWTWGPSTTTNGCQLAAVSTTPRQVGTDSWYDVSTGYNSTATASFGTVAVRGDGTMWFGGNNTNGQGGQGNVTTPVAAMTQVGTDTNWRQCIHGGNVVFGIKSNGTLYGWGAQTNGLLGNGTTASGNITTPTLLDSGSTGWTNAKFSITANNVHVVKSNGQMWTTGNTSAGQAGLGAGTQPASWTRVGTDSDWVDVAPSSSTGTFALKSNGDLYYTGASSGWNGASVNTFTKALDNSVYGYKFTQIVAGGSSIITGVFLIASDNTLHYYGKSGWYDYRAGSNQTAAYGTVVGRLPDGSNISMWTPGGFYIYY